MSEFDFSDMDSEFENAKAAERKNVPDGKVVAVVDRAQLKKAKSSGKPMLNITWKIAEGEHTGRMLWQNWMLVTKENFAWVKKDLETLGLADKIKKLSELEANLGEFLDIKAELTLKSRGENQNIYINKRLGTLDSASVPGSAPKGDAAGAGATGGPSGDGLPF